MAHADSRLCGVRVCLAGRDATSMCDFRGDEQERKKPVVTNTFTWDPKVKQWLEDSNPPAPVLPH
jgi:hypothetical protein